MNCGTRPVAVPAKSFRLKRTPDRVRWAGGWSASGRRPGSIPRVFPASASLPARRGFRFGGRCLPPQARRPLRSLSRPPAGVTLPSHLRILVIRARSGALPGSSASSRGIAAGPPFSGGRCGAWDSPGLAPGAVVALATTLHLTVRWEHHPGDRPPDVRLEVERDDDEPVHAMGPDDREGRDDPEPAGAVLGPVEGGRRQQLGAGPGPRARRWRRAGRPPRPTAPPYRSQALMCSETGLCPGRPVPEGRRDPFHLDEVVVHRAEPEQQDRKYRDVKSVEGSESPGCVGHGEETGSSIVEDPASSIASKNSATCQGTAKPRSSQ
jgi:hypothetical protein